MSNVNFLLTKLSKIREVPVWPQLYGAQYIFAAEIMAASIVDVKIRHHLSKANLMVPETKKLDS